MRAKSKNSSLEDSLGALANLIADSVVIVDQKLDLNGKIIECNNATLSLQGFSSRDELTSKSALWLIAEKDHLKANGNYEGDFGSMFSYYAIRRLGGPK